MAYYDTRIPFQIDLTQAVNGAASIRLSRFYDGAGRQIQTQSVGALVNGAQKNVVTDVQYNNLGQLVKQTVPYSIPYNAAPSFSAQAFTNPYTSTSYDILGRVDTLTAPNGNQTHTSYTRAGSTTTDPQSNATSTSLDAWSRATLVHPPLGPDVAYVYDVLNRLTDSTRAGQTTHISYDAAGRKLGMSDPDMGIWAYGYDALGNLKLQTDARGCALALSYDNLNRLTAKTSSGVGCGTQVSSSYTYDGSAGNLGRRTGMSDASGSTAWSYDLRGRTTQEVKTITGNSFSTAWTYNSADLPVTMTYPDGEIVTNAYNSDGTLKTLSSSLGATYLNDMQHDEAGRTTLMDYGAGVIRKTFAYFAWNTASQGGLLQGMQAARLSDSVSLQNLAYTYEKNGNALSITDSLAGPQTQNFGYDALNRLTSAAASGGTNGLYSETYSYDPTSGNLASKGGLTYTYADPAHVHAVTALSNGNAYAYDPNGSQITRTIAGLGAYTLAYDAENQMTGVSGPNGLNASFGYDGDGKRVTSTIGASTTYFVGNIYEVANGVVTKYYYAGGQRIATRSAGVVSYILGDHLGSTSLTTDAAGLLSSEQRYTAWGEVRYSGGSVPTKYQFTGQYSNVADFGMLFYNARWYDSSLGRFAQADSVAPGGVQGLDRYAGMGNNPVRFVDPTGHRNCIEDDYHCPGYDNYGGGSRGDIGIQLTQAGKNVNNLYQTFRTTLGYWQSQILKGVDSFTLFVAILLSRESAPLWNNPNAGWGKGGANDPKKWFSDAANHWLWGWVKDRYNTSFGNLTQSNKMNAVFNLLGTMESVEGVINASQGVQLNKVTHQLEPDSQYKGLKSDGDRVIKVLKESEYNSDLNDISSNAMNFPTSGYWTWGNEDPVPVDSVYYYGNFYIIDHYR